MTIFNIGDKCHLDYKKTHKRYQSNSNRCDIAFLSHKFFNLLVFVTLVMEMNINLPVPAHWVPGQRASSKILLDPFNVKMWLKSSDKKNKYYICTRKRDLECTVRVTVRMEDDMIV